MSKETESMLALMSFVDGMQADGFTYNDLCGIIIHEIPVDRINEIIQNKGNNRPLNARGEHECK